MRCTWPGRRSILYAVLKLVLQSNINYADVPEDKPVGPLLGLGDGGLCSTKQASRSNFRPTAV